MPVLDGLFAIKIPVTDLARSIEWYSSVFGLRPVLEFPDDDGVLRGVACEAPGLDGTMVALRENPGVARAIAGFDPVLWGVTDREGIEEWIAHLDALGIRHSPVIEATVGWLVVFHDLDGVEHHLYTRTRHGAPQGVEHRGREVQAGATGSPRP
jgi:catechol 2,3-dioxygenase-like lactoylglutathione lyase family enzyme